MNRPVARTRLILRPGRSSLTHDNWQDAAADIEQTTAAATERQYRLAAVAGIALPRDMLQLVAAAKLQTALGADVGSADEAEVGEVQDDMITSLQTPTLRIYNARRKQKRKRAHGSTIFTLSAGKMRSTTGAWSNSSPR
ncbi:hypothetical protein RSO01_74010 [Reyranella soli]|uniref:Uncharacterized protein n=1 Tax=Reyranella soli TaxID=1230389 RepID=A0A512NMR5_9HYPH|nr:hypothetical protein RSO01_74010 [Reyranella soli]